VETLSHLMKVLVADPEVPWGVAESLTVVPPFAVKEVIAAIILLYKYPTSTAGRRLGRIWGVTNDELFRVFVTSWHSKRVSYNELPLRYSTNCVLYLHVSI